MDQVARKTGLSNKIASMRASLYRRKGVPLKYFSEKRAEVNWAGLRTLAERLARDGKPYSCGIPRIDYNEILAGVMAKITAQKIAK